MSKLSQKDLEIYCLGDLVKDIATKQLGKVVANLGEDEYQNTRHL